MIRKSKKQRPKTYKKIAPRRQMFVDEYVKDLNAKQAAIRAGYSEKTANIQGAQLLQRPEITEAIAKVLEERSKETKIDAAWMLKRLATESEADVLDLLDKDGNLKPVKDWPLIWRQGLVAGIDIETITTKGKKKNGIIVRVSKIKLSDRAKRLEMLGRHVDVQAFRDKLGLEGAEKGAPVGVIMMPAKK